MARRKNILTGLAVVLFMLLYAGVVFVLDQSRRQQEYSVECYSGGVSVYHGRVRDYWPSTNGYVFTDIETGQGQRFTSSVVCVSTRIK